MINLFQYGSHMSSERLRKKMAKFAPKYAPSTPAEVEFLGKALLVDWQWVLDLYSGSQTSLVADIVPVPGAEVWGALYRLDKQLVVRDDGGRSVLDRIEGHRPERDPGNYSPISVRVWTKSHFEAAVTYVGTEEARKRWETHHSDATVSEPYAQAVILGAREAELPSDYVSFLKGLLLK